MKSIINQKIVKLLQTKPQKGEVIIEEFGESYWIELVAVLENQTHILVTEYDCDEYKKETKDLIKAELVQDEYTLKDIEGKKIISLEDHEGDFAIGLENDLFFHCSGAPGGNYPWIYKKENS